MRCGLRRRPFWPPSTCFQPRPVEEPVILARQKLRPVFQADAERPLDAGPLCQHLRLHEPSVSPFANSADNRIADTEIPDRQGTSIGHQNRRVSRQAIGAGMGAAAIRVDRPAERHLRRRRYAVEDRLCAHFVEPGVDRLRRVEVPDAHVVVSGQATAVVERNPLLLPAHQMPGHRPRRLRSRHAPGAHRDHDAQPGP